MTKSDRAAPLRDLSLFLPNLTSVILEKFTNRGFTESPLIIESEFLQQIELD